MTVTKVELQISVSRNYDKVSLGMVDEPITHESEDELIAGIRRRFALIRAEIELQYSQIQKK